MNKQQVPGRFPNPVSSWPEGATNGHRETPQGEARTDVEMTEGEARVVLEGIAQMLEELAESLRELMRAVYDGDGDVMAAMRAYVAAADRLGMSRP